MRPKTMTKYTCGLWKLRCFIDGISWWDSLFPRLNFHFCAWSLTPIFYEHSWCQSFLPMKPIFSSRFLNDASKAQTLPEAKKKNLIKEREKIKNKKKIRRAIMLSGLKESMKVYAFFIELWGYSTNFPSIIILNQTRYMSHCALRRIAYVIRVDREIAKRVTSITKFQNFHSHFIWSEEDEPTLLLESLAV